MSDNKTVYIMSKMPVNRAILKMSIPVVCGMMVQVLYNLVDTYFIGRLGDANQLAAANITAPVFMILMAIATIVSTGASSIVSRSLGEKDAKTANQALSTGVIICIGLAVCVMACTLPFVRQLVITLGASTAVAPFAYDYAFIMLLGSIPVMLSYAGGQLVRSEGATMPSVMGMLIGTVVNIILDPIFIFTLNMGIRGAAIATVIGNIAAMSYYVYFYLSKKSIVKISMKYVSLSKKIWSGTFGIGVPAMLSQLLMSVALIICNNLAKGYGDNVIAGMGVAAKLMFIGTFVFMGFAAGCQPLVGFNYGAKDFSRVNAIIKSSMMMTTAIGVVMLAVFALFAEPLIAIFTPLYDVIVQGGIALRIHAWSFLVLGPQMLSSTAIQAFGKAKESLILSISRQGLFFIPLLFLLNAQYQYAGLMWAQPISDLFTLALGLALLMLILRKNDPSKAKEGVAP